MFNQNFGVVNQALLRLRAAALRRHHSAWKRIRDPRPRGGLAPCRPLHPDFPDQPANPRQVAGRERSIDGAGRWQRFFYVTLPQLRPAITINTVYALIEFLKTFTVIFVITKGRAEFLDEFRFLLCLFQIQQRAIRRSNGDRDGSLCYRLRARAASYWYMERGDQVMNCVADASQTFGDRACSECRGALRGCNRRRAHVCLSVLLDACQRFPQSGGDPFGPAAPHSGTVST